MGDFTNFKEMNGNMTNLQTRLASYETKVKNFRSSVIKEQFKLDNLKEHPFQNFFKIQNSKTEIKTDQENADKYKARYHEVKKEIKELDIKFENYISDKFKDNPIKLKEQFYHVELADAKVRSVVVFKYDVVSGFDGEDAKVWIVFDVNEHIIRRVYNPALLYKRDKTEHHESILEWMKEINRFSVEAYDSISKSNWASTSELSEFSPELIKKIDYMENWMDHVEIFEGEKIGTATTVDDDWIDEQDVEEVTLDSMKTKILSGAKVSKKRLKRSDKMTIEITDLEE